MTNPSLVKAFEETGRVWLRNAVSEKDLALLDTTGATPIFRAPRT